MKLRRLVELKKMNSDLFHADKSFKNLLFPEQERSRYRRHAINHFIATWEQNDQTFQSVFLSVRGQRQFSYLVVTSWLRNYLAILRYGDTTLGDA